MNDLQGIAARKRLILSPLLNLAPGAPHGARIVQHVRLRDARGGELAEAATLTLRPDRRSLAVKMPRDPRAVAAIALRRLGPLARLGKEPNDRELRVLEIELTGSGESGGELHVEMPLPESGPLECVSSEYEPLTARALEEIRATAVLGISVSPLRQAAARNVAEQREDADLRYLRRRLWDELEAAFMATQAASTSRHVELASLYARAIGNAGPELRGSRPA